MTELRNVAALILRDMNQQLLNLHMSYQLAREAKALNHREENITLEYTSGLYHDTGALFSSISSYIQANEQFSTEEMNRIFTMPYAELRTTTEFTKKEDHV